MKRRSKRVARGWSQSLGSGSTVLEHNDSNDSGSSGVSPLASHSTDEDEMEDDDTDSSSTAEFRLCNDAGGGNGYPTLPKIRKKSLSFRGFKVRTISAIETRTTRPMVSINSAILNDDFVREFNAQWLSAEGESGDGSSKSKAHTSKIGDGSKPLGDDTVTLYSSPFTICVTQNFVENESFIEQLVHEMCQMEWQRKQIDLYEFHQTTDLVNVTKPALKTFFDTLTNVMLPWMETITGLSLTHVSASCSMYNYGDFLLVHDDLLTDRQIAFVYYVSPWPSAKEWTDDMGGALELFECEAKTGRPKYPIVKKIPPRNNQFTFFRVCQKSFHQVGEVTNLVYPRLTINGWFHGHAKSRPSSHHHQKDSGCSTSAGTTDEIANSTLPPLMNNYLTYSAPVMDDLDLSEWINLTYLKTSTKKCIQNHIEEKSEASLEQFLIGAFHDVLVSEFRTNNDLEWILEGPANQRKYETLRLAPHSTGPPKDLHTLFSSKSMFSLLAQYTDLDFVGPNAQSPKCSVQICRFTQGCYTLLGDSSTFTENALDIVLFFNAKDQVGTITYLSPECMGGGGGGDVTRDADATTSSEWSEPSMTMTSTTTNAIATTAKASGSATEMLVKSKANAFGNNSTRYNTSKHKSNASATSTSILTSGDDTAADVSSLSYDPNEDVEVISILNQQDRNETGTSSAAATSMSDAIDDDDFDTDYGRSANKVSRDSDSDDDDIDDLAQEHILLTVHPKNNALNLVYRSEGQAKFVKYVSKNCIEPDEYVYILFATFKE